MLVAAWLGVCSQSNDPTPPHPVSLPPRPPPLPLPPSPTILERLQRVPREPVFPHLSDRVVDLGVLRRELIPGEVVVVPYHGQHRLVDEVPLDQVRSVSHGEEEGFLGEVLASDDVSRSVATIAQKWVEVNVDGD